MLTLLHPPMITGLTAGILGLLYVLLSVLVVVNRGSSKVTLGDGDGDHAALLMAIRAHANFAEYTPYILVLLAYMELVMGQNLFVQSEAAALILARVLHAMGMYAGGTNPMRAMGFLLTMVVLFMLSGGAVLTVLG